MTPPQGYADDPFGHLHDEDFEAAYAAPIIGSESGLFMGGRQTESLDGPWHFTLDLYDEGLRQKWYAYKPLAPEDWTVPRDYDPWLGDTVPVPSCWNLLKPEWFYFEGTAWYSRLLAIDPPKAGERVFLRIGAAANSARVFLNGAFLGVHHGASTPFCIDLTDRIESGDNRLLIAVNNTRHRGAIPMRHTDWFNYGGIHREVSLIRVPRRSIRDFFVHLVPDGTFSRIALRAEIQDPSTNADAGPVRFFIPELGVDVTVPVVDGIATVTVAAKPDLWSPARPRLYDVVAEIDGDRVDDRVGFREIRADGTRIRLNGEDIFLKGISVHEDDVETGRVTSPADIERRFRHAKALGCNFLRLTHYPHHEDVARLADTHGILLWSEIPVYWAVDFTAPATYDDADNQLRELIRRDRNRASVIVWSVGNENADTDARLSFMSQLADTARAMDPTRPVAAACLLDFKNLRIADRLTDHLDIIGINEYFGWYLPNMDDLVAIGRNSQPSKPVIITETGAGAVAGRTGPQGALFTESHMADVYRRQLKVIETLDYVRGLTPWILYDFRSERRRNPFQRGFNRKGLIAEDKETRKSAFGVLAAFYRSRE